MSCGMSMIKYLLIIFNFIFAICGLAILTLGVIIYLQISDVTDQLNGNLMFPSVTLIVLGSIIFVISFFGCCAPIRNSHCMSVTFASFLLLILLIQVAVAIYGFVVVKNSDMHVDIAENYQKIFNGYYTQKENKEVVDIVQSALHCCGVESKSDFNKIGSIPWSCCGKREGETCSAQESYNTGCVKEIKSTLSVLGNVFGGVAIGVAAVELLGIIFSLCLANSIRNEKRRGYRV